MTFRVAALHAADFDRMSRRVFSSVLVVVTTEVATDPLAIVICAGTTGAGVLLAAAAILASLETHMIYF